MQTIAFFIPGEPPKVTAQMRRVIVRKGVPMFVDTPALKATKNFYISSCAAFRPSKPLVGPLGIRVQWEFPFPKETPKNKRDTHLWKTTRPDLDNMEKALLDVLQEVGFFHDDAQIAQKETLKVFSHRPGVQIEIVEKVEGGWQ